MCMCVYSKRLPSTMKKSTEAFLRSNLSVKSIYCIVTWISLALFDEFPSNVWSKEASGQLAKKYLWRGVRLELATVLCMRWGEIECRSVIYAKCQIRIIVAEWRGGTGGGEIMCCKMGNNGCRSRRGGEVGIGAQRKRMVTQGDRDYTV